jgi:uncharacterized RDD family membrane protein YckC
MESEFDLNTLLSLLKANVKEWIKIRIQLLKLELIEIISTVGSFLIYSVIIINLLFFIFLFAFVALGLLFGKWLNSIAGGFAIVCLLYFVILAIMLLFRKCIFTGIQNLLLKELNPETEDETVP